MFPPKGKLWRQGNRPFKQGVFLKKPLMLNAATFKLRKKAEGINVPLLLFLLLFLDVKIIVKIIGILFIYTIQSNLQLGMRWRQSRLPIFYVLIAGIGVADWLIYGNFLSFRYNVALLDGMIYWLLALLAVHQLKLFTEKIEIPVLHRTVRTFFIINALVSIVSLLLIIVEIKHFNPYLYQGNFQKYFLNTGDYIKGVTCDVSITNAAITSIGVIYFLVRNDLKMLLLNMAILLLTTSNAMLFLLFTVLVFMGVYKTTAAQKSAIVCCLMLTLVFVAKVSPQNMYYVDKLYQKIVLNRNISFDPVAVKQPRITDIPDNQLNPEQRKQKIAQFYLDSLGLKIGERKGLSKAQIQAVPLTYVLPTDSIHTAKFQSRADTDARQKRLQAFMYEHHLQSLLGEKKTGRITPGKLLAGRQTVNFFSHHPALLIAGAGMGNFSSKLAFRATALGVAGGYPHSLAYISPWFLANHLSVYLDYFSQKRGFHSLIHAPDAVYSQLLGEYGIAGLVVFFVFYIGYFIRFGRHLTYGLPLILFMLLVFFTGYWFEQLSIVVLFELLLFIDIKEQAPQT
jgi:hypothetical protein